MDSGNSLFMMNKELGTTVLFAQVKSGKPLMKVEQEGSTLRHKNHPCDGGPVLIGDVTDTLIRVFGPHEPPIFEKKPKFDEQDWSLSISDSTMKISITSHSYWGFGLFSRCYLNKIELRGSLKRRARIIFDLISSIGRNPWEAFWNSRWEKITQTSAEEHKEQWNELLEFAKENMEEEINQSQISIENLKKKLKRVKSSEYKNWNINESMNFIDEANLEIERGRKLLHDRNATALERALARIEVLLIQADPSKEIKSNIFDEANELLDEDVVVDTGPVEEKIVYLEKLPDDEIEELPLIDLVSELEEE